MVSTFLLSYPEFKLKTRARVQVRVQVSQDLISLHSLQMDPNMMIVYEFGHPIYQQPFHFSKEDLDRVNAYYAKDGFYLGTIEDQRELESKQEEEETD